MDCCYCCCFFIFPNTFNVSEISKSINQKLYREYISKFKKGFKLNLIYFRDEYKEDDKNKKIESILINKILNEINKLNINKYEFWTGYSMSFVEEQISYYIFSLLINPDSLFEIKELNDNILQNINFDFSDTQVNDFKKSFFCKKDGTLIDIETETDKDIHLSLNIKLTNKLRDVIENIDFSIIIPIIINSYVKIKNNKEENKKNTFDQII